MNNDTQQNQDRARTHWTKPLRFSESAEPGPYQAGSPRRDSHDPFSVSGFSCHARRWRELLEGQSNTAADRLPDAIARNRNRTRSCRSGSVRRDSSMNTKQCRLDEPSQLYFRFNLGGKSRTVFCRRIDRSGERLS